MATKKTTSNQDKFSGGTLNRKGNPDHAFGPLLTIAVVILVLQLPLITRLQAQKTSQEHELEKLEQDFRASNSTDLRMQQILGELLNLAKTDADARAIVDKYGINAAPPAGN